ncbi:phenylalanine aminomutase L-beta-phenylalanine forming [Rhypophila decipiens]|uniref:Phenylalanine aminomutase L-beta-phenylalanine forming n=1 Tax=Rhypophila decipiens TaxID=261697 RepID=A0AAN6Y1V6_9PEZI|nr:phenylalanine aminomutase L-beta-phenylalanine forming [Rhypophila decipiens]
MTQPNQHYHTASGLWAHLEAFTPGQKVIVTGKGLDISTVVAVSRGIGQPHLTEDEATVARIRDSVKVLAEYLDQGSTVYGVTTGFGGSADTRTNDSDQLQNALLQLTQCGVLLESDKSAGTGTTDTPSRYNEPNAMPASWIRATMLVRCNATARGHSAVTIDALQAILRLLRLDMTPIVPLRGTVSASGDLMPLSYIAGAIQGNPDIAIRSTSRKHESDAVAVVVVESAKDALARHGIPKVVFGPKDALGLVNGTALSAAMAALVMYEAHHLAVLSQAFTAMAVESLAGNAESFHPFMAQVRPHPGQIEASNNILSFLQGSRLARGIKPNSSTTTAGLPSTGLAQDRYALRSAPQWIGPQLEDLLSAHTQVTTELNSSADNPLVDVSTSTVYSGANFQAASITSAMEKTRLALQMLGRLLFAQSTELINPSLNNGLPANLAADDPSTSFTMKGVDISMAAYMSELCFLASPVGPHVQVAEMHNQSVNSLAFLSARMTHKAVEVLSLMAAACLFVGCQALDLRALQVEFLEEVGAGVERVTLETLGGHLDESVIEKLLGHLRTRIPAAWKDASRLDVPDRVKAIGDAAVLGLVRNWKGGASVESSSGTIVDLDLAEEWRCAVEKQASVTYRDICRRFFARPSTEKHLGSGSRALYRKIRHELGVPFHQGVVEHPGREDHIVHDGETRRPRKTIGSWISVIYQALLDGRIYEALYSGEAAVGKGEMTNGQTNGRVKKRKRSMSGPNSLVKGES